MQSTTLLLTDVAHDLVREVVAGHGGVVGADTVVGEGAVVVFNEAPAAVAAALAVQLAHPAEAPRVALHTGPVERRDDGTCFGPAVVRAGRLRDVCHPGQTLLSDHTRAALADELPEQAALRSLGAHRLKDLGRVERVWQLCHPGLKAD